jgi:hypothetical protein
MIKIIQYLFYLGQMVPRHVCLCQQDLAGKRAVWITR